MSESSAAARLETTLRELIEPEREAFVAMAFDHLKSRLEWFLERRKPNRTEFDVMKDRGGSGSVLGLREATDYAEAERRSYTRRNQEAWDVTWKPDADAILRGLAAGIAEEYIQTFLKRSLEKLSPVIDRRPEYTVTKGVRCSLRGGAWFGVLVFAFPDRTGFTVQLAFKANQTKYGRGYAQYPCTVHEAVLAPGEKPRGASIEDVWKSVGYIPPAKPAGPPRKRWTKLVSGSVVAHEGRPVLLPTPGAAKKLGIPDDAPQLARIEASPVHGRVEYANATARSVQWSEPQRVALKQIMDERGYDAAKRAAREAAFAHFFPDKTT